VEGDIGGGLLGLHCWWGELMMMGGSRRFKVVGVEVWGDW